MNTLLKSNFFIISIGAININLIFDLHSLDNSIPNNMIDFISNLEINIGKANNAIDGNQGIDISEVQLLSPVLNPPSVKDGYAF